MTTATTATNSRYKVLGINDDQESCDCCGKQGLKRVVWIEDTETGAVMAFGTTCALKPSKGFGRDTETNIKKAIRAFDQWQQSRWQQAHFFYRKAGGKYCLGDTPCSSKVVDMPLYEKILAELIVKHPAPMEAR